MASSARLTDTGIGLRSEVDDNTTQLAQIVTEKSGYGVISGLGVTQQSVPDMTVRVALGVIWMANGDRFAPTANNALSITAAAATMRRDLIYVNSAGVIAYLAGTAATLGHRTYTITTNAVAGDTFIVNGVTFTAVAAGATGAQFNVGATADDTATNLASVINSHASFSPYYTVSAATNIITILQKVAVDGAYTPTARTGTGTIAVTSTLVASAVGASVPDVPTGGQRIASIFVTVGKTSILTADIFARRKYLFSEDPIIPTLLNGWTVKAGSAVMYRKSVSGLVTFQGQLVPGTSAVKTFGVDLGYRPSNDLLFAVQTSGGVVVSFGVLSTGDVYHNAAALGTYVDLSAISYYAV